MSALYRAYIRDEVLGPVGLPVDDDALADEAPPLDLVPPGGEMLLVTFDGEPVAIGGVRGLDTEVAEIKSMYVVPSARGAGLGRQLLARLEQIAAAHGCRAVRLDTATHLTGAIALYRALGYHEIPAYNTGPLADLWFERRLGSRARGRERDAVSASTAVSATALAGYGRGRDGRGCEEWRGSSTRAPRVRHGRSGRIASQKTRGVTENVGSPRFRACWTTVTTALPH